MTTFLSLRNQARRRADMENSKFIEEDELGEYINNSIKELYDLLIATYEDYYIKDPVQFTLTGTQDGYALPSDFYKLRGLDQSWDSSGSASSWRTMQNFNFLDRNRLNLSNARTTLNVKYRVFANSAGPLVKLMPPENAAGVYQLWYIPTCPTLVADDDEFDGINGWEEYAIVDTCIKMLQKEESDASVFVAQKKALVDRIEAMAADRDAGEPEQIGDARGRNNGDFGSGGFYS